MANHTDWLNISTMSGSSGRTILSLTANTNTQGTDKVAIVKAYNPALNVSATTTVRLSAYTPYITVSPDYVGIASSGGTYELSIQANCSYNISYPEMVTDYSASSGVGNTNITFTVPSNTEQDTIVGTIVFTDITGQYSATVRLEQYAQPVSILYNPTAITIPYYGGDASFYVSANCAYSISAGSGTWYSVSPQTGYTGETEFVISAPNSNTGNTDWTDSINIVGPEGVAAVLPVTQLNWGQYHFDYTADTSNIAYSGEQRTITLDTTDAINSSITIEIVGAPDVTYSYSASGLTRGIITVNVSQNPGLERTFKVVVRGRRAASQNYSTAVIEYTQNALQLDFVTDTSNVAGVGEVRTITILTSNINPNRTGLNLPSDFPQTGSYTVSGNVITLTYPKNPSSSASRTWTIRVLAQTNDGVSLSGSYQITQNANRIYPIPYTGDTSEVAATGETRVITIDASNLIPSSITIGVVGATGVTYSYDNGVITVSFPENFGGERNITLSIDGKTTDGDVAEADITFSQEGGDLPSTPLTFNILSGGTIVWKAEYSAFTRTIEYKKNNGNWTSITSNTGASAPSISVNAGDIVKFRGDNATYATNNYTRYNSFSGTTAKFEADGNIMSLIDSKNFATATTLASSYTFYNFFSQCTGLTSAENLVLPATTLTDYCYGSMFSNCTSLTTAPVLPATTLANSCYINMFQNCTSLTTAPELPATTLNEGCYRGMFQGCTSLTTAPVLPATTLVQYCYQSMFAGCTSLTSALELSATTLAYSCCEGMFGGCTSLTSAPELPATTLAEGCYSNMFYGCTSLTTAPVLPATTLAIDCYYKMFSGCTSLNNIKCLATNISASDCTYKWVDGVAATGTFVKPYEMSDWTIGNNGIPIGWIIDDGPQGDYLTFKITSGGTILWKNNGYAKSIEYKKNDEEWISITSSTSGTPISVIAGDVVQFRGNNATYAANTTQYNSFSGTTAKFEVEGNIMSLIDSENFATATTLVSSITFFYLFRQCTGLTSAENLVLPATTLASYCYSRMFYNCTSLTSAPELPATTLAGNCYYYMFNGCTSLTSAPALPATTLASGCYNSMFYNCTSLTTAPELPATTLAGSCYGGMFQGCTSLTTAPELPATTLVGGCYRFMFYGCTSLTTAPVLPATTLADMCYVSMFHNCRSLTTAPALPATILAENCCQSMFRGCTSLTSAPALPATTLASNCYWEMFFDCTSLTSAPELPATTLASYCYRSMFSGCRSLNHLKCLATNIEAEHCTLNWVENVASTGTFVTPSSTNWATGVSGIPSGWTRVNA